jgi:hypothetical protein
VKDLFKIDRSFKVDIENSNADNYCQYYTQNESIHVHPAFICLRKYTLWIHHFAYMFSLKLLSQLANFRGARCEGCGLSDHSNVTIFNFLQSVIRDETMDAPTWEVGSALNFES